MYGVMVIDMGVHQLSGLLQKVNLTQVCVSLGVFGYSNPMGLRIVMWPAR